VTPARFVAAIALVGSLAVVAYGLFVDRSGSTIAFTVAGLAVLGVTFVFLALRLAAVSVTAGRDGRGGRAVGSAVLGGISAVLASGALSSAVILGLLARPA
jgi:hypothetical protein